MNYADELKGNKPASEKWRSPFHRQLSRCIQFATDPWFENSTGRPRTDRQMYEESWTESCTGPESERTLIRRNVGSMYRYSHPHRCRELPNTSHQACPFIMLDPRQVKEPPLPPPSDPHWSLDALKTGIGDIPKDVLLGTDEPIKPIVSQLGQEPESDTQGEQW